MTIKTLSLVLLALPFFVQAQEPAAEVTLVTGIVTASTASGARYVGAGAPVFAGDTLNVGANSYANLKFPDGGRVLLRPNTEFTVEAYKYDPLAVAEPAPAAPPKGQAKAAAPTQQAFFRLLRGGFRAVSGLIGRVDQQSYRVTTPVATIGIRGTDYEVQICSDDCPTGNVPAKAGAENAMVASRDLSGLQLAQAGGAGDGSAGGVVLATNEGTVVMQTGRGEYLIRVGEVAFAMANGQVFMLPAVPDVLLYNQTPSPEDCN